MTIDPFAALKNHLAALPDGKRWSSLELHLDNDANLAALAELKVGAAFGRQNVFYVHIDEAGIGAGLIFNGRSYRGAGGIAGEFGHVVLEPDRSEKCPRCGQPCVEKIVLTKLGCMGPSSSYRPLLEIVRAAVEGDDDATRAIRDAADYLGRALAPFVTLLNFDRILIGGPFPPQAYGLVIPPVQAALEKLTIAPAAGDYVVELGALREDASLIGAVWLALARTRVNYLLRHTAQAEPPSPGPATTVPEVVLADALPT